MCILLQPTARQQGHGCWRQWKWWITVLRLRFTRTKLPASAACSSRIVGAPSGEAAAAAGWSRTIDTRQPCIADRP